jgi:hypothetical protein
MDKAFLVIIWYNKLECLAETLISRKPRNLPSYGVLRSYLQRLDSAQNVVTLQRITIK